MNGETQAADRTLTRWAGGMSDRFVHHDTQVINPGDRLFYTVTRGLAFCVIFIELLLVTEFSEAPGRRERRHRGFQSAQPISPPDRRGSAEFFPCNGESKSIVVGLSFGLRPSNIGYPLAEKPDHEPVLGTMPDTISGKFNLNKLVIGPFWSWLEEVLVEAGEITLLL
jgi:hypothetical protein